MYKKLYLSLFYLLTITFTSQPTMNTISSNNNHGPVFALHEHELKPGINVEEYEHEVANAIQSLKVPELLHAYFLKGFKGERSHCYAVLWVWENAHVIEENFGTLDNPKWPQDWLYYENQILAKYLTCHPDTINFTDYDILKSIEYKKIK